MEHQRIHIMNMIINYCSDFIPVLTFVLFVGLIIVPVTHYLFSKQMADEGIQTVIQSTNVEGVQTVEPTFAEAGVQTDSLPNTITSVDTMAEYPNLDYPVMEPTVLPQPSFTNEVGVETSSYSLCGETPNYK